jgi:glucose-6-phosphate 1-dehydrogenase
VPPLGNSHITPPSVPGPPEPFTLVIFGASGDLTRRKVIPSIFDLWRDGHLPRRFAVVGYARTPMSDDAWRDALRQGVAEFSRAGTGDDAAWADFASRLAYLTGGYDDLAGFRRLGEHLDAGAADGTLAPNRLFYLATPPGTFGSIVRSLGASGLARPDADGGPWARVIIEKPFGHDLADARRLSAEVHRAFAEHQIFRIDHYLGKETVQNILVLRFANAIFDPLWNQKYVDHVQVTVAEREGVGTRGSYYDASGALRDMVQNHMVHLVSLVAMEPPVSLEADAIRDEKVKVLQALRPVPADGAPGRVVRAQYAAGTVDGRPVPGYRDEPGVPGDSRTETFVALKLFIDNWRWSGVPFYLRTGKRLPVRITEIDIHFKPIPQVLFGEPPYGPLQPNVLAIRIQPNDGITMRFQVKVPGAAMHLEPYQMDFGYAEAFRAGSPDAYERLILDAALGDPTRFTRTDEVEEAWAFVQPILDGCADCRDGCLPTYPAGSWGPAEADRLIRDDGRDWMLVRRRGGGR